MAGSNAFTCDERAGWERLPAPRTPAISESSMRCPAGKARRAGVIRASWNHPATAVRSRRSAFFRVQVGEST